MQTKGIIRGTPLIHKDKIYINSYGKEFIAVNENDGQIVWELDTGAPSQSSPTYVPDKDCLIFATHGWGKGRLFAVSAKTGKKIWNKKIDNNFAVSSGVSFFFKKTREIFISVSLYQ